VIVPSEAEGFGLAVLEALAATCRSSHTGRIHAEALAGIEGTLCAPYDHDRWRCARATAGDDDPRVAGRARRASIIELMPPSQRPAGPARQRAIDY